MKIQVEDKLFIESDERQFMLKQYSGKIDDKGNEGYKVLGYFPKLQQVVKHLVKLEVMKSDATSIKELLADLDRIETRIENLIRV